MFSTDECDLNDSIIHSDLQVYIDLLPLINSGLQPDKLYSISNGK